MKDGLMSAEINATNISGSTIYASTTMSGGKMFSAADITAGTTVTAGTGITASAGNITTALGSMIMLAGSVGSNIDVGSLTQYN